MLYVHVCMKSHWISLKGDVFDGNFLRHSSSQSIFITRIAQGGLAEQDGRLRLGDKLISVSKTRVQSNVLRS